MSKKSFADANISMEAQVRPDLTEGQKACLHLVRHHFTSKEIARELGISRFTVDQRLDAARRKLNARSRKDAAKIFATLEGSGISEPFVYEASALEEGNKAYIPKVARGRNGGRAKKKGSWLARLTSRGNKGHKGRGADREISVRKMNIIIFGSMVVAFIVMGSIISLGSDI